MKSGKATATGLAAVTMWGLAPVATRAVVVQFGPLPLLVLRAFLAAAVLLPWAIPVLRHGPRGRLAVAGVLGMVGYNLPVAEGIRYLPASTAALILATEPVWILALGRLLAAERVARGAWLGSAVALGGVAVIAGPQFGAGGKTLIGMGLVMLGTALFAGYTIALRPLTKEHGAVAATAASTVIGAVPYLALCPFVPLSVLAGRPVTSWADLAFLAFGSTVAGMAAWNMAVGHLGSAKAGLLLFLEPCIGVTGGVVLLGEHLTVTVLAGGAVVMVGVVIAWVAQRSLNVGLCERVTRRTALLVFLSGLSF
jgi:drug/metabolite transporter (DMT)-like permease